MKKLFFIGGCLSVLLTMLAFNNQKMTNLQIIKSTYEGKTSEENGKNLAKYVAEDISWTEAKGFPYAGTYIGLESVTKNVFSRLGSEWVDYKFTPEDYVASEDKVVAYGTYTGTYKLTGKSFVRPEKFSLERTLRDSFGVHSGQGAFDVAIRFSSAAASYIREKRWHPSQQLRELKGGAVELRLRLSSLGEIERWVLGWGGNAVPLRPPELVASIKRAAGNILKNIR